MVGIDLLRVQLEVESFQHALFRDARWEPRATLVHVSAGPPATPDGGLAPGRCCPWPPSGRLPNERKASVLTPIHLVALWCASWGAPWFTGPPMAGDSWS